MKFPSRLNFDGKVVSEMGRYAELEVLDHTACI